MTDQKIFWASNVKFMRMRKKLSQDELAAQLGITRSKLNAHENGVSKNPPLDDLLRFSSYYKLAVDTLLKVDLSKLPELKLRELEAGNDVYISGGRLRVLSITVNSDNRENIEFVPKKAKAGYLAGYNDPEYIGQLPKFTLPFLPENKSFRMFPTEGDSMYPIPENCLVICEYVTDWNLLAETPCIVIMRSEQQFLFKIVSLKGEHILLHSLNAAYKDVEVAVEDVLEVWKYHSHVTDVLPFSSKTINDEILRTVKEIQADMHRLGNK